MSAPLAISLRGVTKRYGPITAVDRPEGTCIGLLGPNGAGKSTTMKMLTAQAIPDAGAIRVLGFDVPRDSKQARALCGVVPQLDNLDVELTARQNLAVFARLYRVPRTERRAAVDRARPRAPPAAAAARRADRRTRPAGAAGAVGADRRAAQRGHVDLDVDPLHRGGR